MPDRSSREDLAQQLFSAGSHFQGTGLTCPFCGDEHASGSLYCKDGVWRFKCHSKCGFCGDVYDVIAKAQGKPVETVLKDTAPESPQNPHKTPAKAQGPRLYPNVQAIAALVKGTVQAVYEYRSPDTDTLELAVIRYLGPDGRKQFWQCSPRPGGWAIRRPDGPLPLYNRSALRDAPAVIVVEGEKCVEACRSVGLAATTSPMGAGKAKLADWSPLAGKTVTLWPDNDDPGRKHMADVADLLQQLKPAPSVTMLDPEALGLDAKGDVADMIQAYQDCGLEPADIALEVLAVVQKAKPIEPKPDESGLVIVPAEVYLATDPPPADQVMAETFDTGDKVALIGSSKLRKSFFLLQMTLSIAAGKEFIGWKIPRARRVLVVQFEIKSNHWHRRVRRMAQAMGIQMLEGRLGVINARGLGIAGAKGVEKIIGKAKDHGAEVVCLDPLYKIAAGAENAAEDFKVVLNAFDTLAEQTGAAVIYVHHDTKGISGDRDIRDRGAGSNVLGRDYDACITLTPHESEEETAVVETLLRNYKGQKPFVVAWVEDMETQGYRFDLRRDIDPKKRTSLSLNGEKAKTMEQLLEIAMTLLKNGAMLMRDFESGCMDRGMRRDEYRNFKAWALLNGHLDCFEERGKRVHNKWIGTKEQISEKRF